MNTDASTLRSGLILGKKRNGSTSIPSPIKIVTAVLVTIALVLTLGSYSQVRVSTSDTNKNAISGYQVVLYQNGKVVGTGYSGSSSDTFTLTNGQQYTLQVYDYGSCHFNHWEDTGGANRSRSISIIGNKELTAVYACAGTPATSQLGIVSKDEGGAVIAGIIVRLSSEGSTVDSGSTPHTFMLISGKAYMIQVYDSGSYDSGSCRFDHWQDTNSTSASRTLSATSDVQLTAIYVCDASKSSSVTVKSLDSGGKPIFGFYTVLYDSSGKVVSTGFTTKSFSTRGGQTYLVSVGGFGKCSFTRWSDGITSNPRKFTAANSSLSFTAVFDCAPASTASP
jgi:hypothetical protein